MNIAARPTTVITTAQEINLRTLATDIASLEHGSQAPAPEHLTAEVSAETEQETVQLTRQRAAGAHLLLTLFILLAIAGVVYFVVWPYVMSSGPTVI